MNILILGTGSIEQKLIELCLKSKHLDHLYTASKEPLENIPNIEYSAYEELCQKAKAIQADVVLFADKKYIQEGIVDILKKHLINVISVNEKWLNLETKRLVAKQLMNYYSINNPEKLLAPISFPVVIKTNNPCSTKLAYSMQELIDIRKDLMDKSAFLEEYLQGDIFYLLTLWDGKNIIYFDNKFKLTEVQQDRLDLLKTKLNFMLSDEKADFLGFFTIKMIWAKNDWYILEYIMRIDENVDLENIEKDFLYILNSAIYQKLNEV